MDMMQMEEAKRSASWFSTITSILGFGSHQIRPVFADAHLQPWAGEHPVFVHGLPLPKLLVEMLANGSWKHPGDEVIAKEFPFFRGEEFDLLPKRSIEHEPEPWNAKYIGIGESSFYFMHEIRGSRKTEDTIEEHLQPSLKWVFAGRDCKRYRYREKRRRKDILYRNSSFSRNIRG